MERICVQKILQQKNELQNITVCGWVKTRRDNKSFVFLELNDGSCLANIQCIIDEGTDAFKALEGVNTGAAVKIMGDIVKSPGKEQNVEIHAKTMTIFGLADSETFPLQKKRHSDEYLRTIAHLRPRTNKYGAIFRVRSEAAHAVHSYFYNQGYYYVHTPILTGADCEGAGEMFRVSTLPLNAHITQQKEQNTPNPQNTAKPDNNATNNENKQKINTETNENVTQKNNIFQHDFFGKEAKLTVSGQLEAETLATALGKVYTFGPTFRAENSNTPRHAAEFWMIEPEAAFMDLQGDITLGEELVQYVTKHVMEKCEDELALLNKFVEPTLLDCLKDTTEKKFQRISYRDAVKVLNDCKKQFEYKVSFGTDLQTEHERFLAEEYFKSPVTVYDYPKEIKAFYMRMNDDNETVAAMDLLVPRIGELIGGSQREERLDVLTKRLIELNHNPDDFWWYLDLRRFGTVPHAGFGLGFERLVMMLTGVSNIRDVIPFPRTVGSLEF